MDFTELFSQSYGIVQFSPGGQFILSAVRDRLVVRRIDKEGILQSWLVDTNPSATTAALAKGAPKPAPSDGWITHAAWSPESEYIFAAVAKRGIVNVYSMHDEKWNARIEAGAEGLTKAEWAPDGRSIVCFSEWGLRVTIWSLSSGTATYIQYPKHTDRGYGFRKDGRYFVLAERHKSKDMMGVYECPIGYKLVRHFPLPTSSLASIALSPSGNHIAVWESVIEFKVVIMNLVGQHLGTFTPDDNHMLGVRQLAWHPSGSFLAIGGYDSKIYIISSLEWKLVATLSLTSKLGNGTVLWREPLNWITNSHNRGFLPFKSTTSTTSEPIIINVTKPSTLAPTITVANTSPAPKSGVVSLQFSTTGSILLVTWEQCPAYVFIYNFPISLDEAFQPRLRSVIQCNQSILQAQISNVPKLTGTTVAICSGTTAVYLWNDDRVLNDEGEKGELAECVGIPTNKRFSCRDIRWSHDGRGMILLDKDTFCAAFEVEGE